MGRWLIDLHACLPLELGSCPKNGIGSGCLASEQRWPLRPVRHSRRASRPGTPAVRRKRVPAERARSGPASTPFFAPVSYSADEDPSSPGFDTHLGYESDLLTALEAMRNTGLSFSRSGIAPWDDIWLRPDGPEYDLVSGRYHHPRFANARRRRQSGRHLLDRLHRLPAEPPGACRRCLPLLPTTTNSPARYASAPWPTRQENPDCWRSPGWSARMACWRPGYGSRLPAVRWWRTAALATLSPPPANHRYWPSGCACIRPPPALRRSSTSVTTWVKRN